MTMHRTGFRLSSRTALAMLAITALCAMTPFATQAADDTAATVPDVPPKAPDEAGTPAAAPQKGLHVDDIVITGTWTPHAQKDSPVEIERITSKMIEQAGATNLRQVLQDVPAIEFRRTGGRFQQFQIQGLESIHTLFLVNGQELIGSTEGGQFTEDLLASPDVESIEVVKGAAAVQYGSDAIGGVINIRTKRATKTLGGTITGQYGRYNTVTSFAAPEFRSADGKFGGYIAAGVSKSDGVDYIPSTPVTNGEPRYSTKNISANFDYAFSNSAKFSLYNKYTDQDRVSLGGTTAASTRTQATSNNERNQTVARMDWSPDAVSTLSIWGHYQSFQNESRTNALGTGAQTRVSKFTQTLWEPQFQYTRQLDQHHLLTLGGEHDIRSIEGLNFASSSAVKRLTESAGWLQDEIAMLPWVDIVLGSRYTTNSKAGGAWSPQATLLLKPGNFRGRFSYTKGFRSPSLSELGASFVEGGFFGIVGNPNLAPEKSTSYTANVEYYFERAKIGASVFRHDVNNLIQFINGTCSAAEAAGLGVAQNFCQKPFNTAVTRSQGFELEAGIRPLSWLYLETGYMYVDARDHTTDEYLFGRSRHTWKTRANIEYDGWTYTTRLRYFSSFGFTDTNNNGRIDRNQNELAPANVQLDMRLAKTLANGMDLYIGADNITKARVQVGGVPPPEGQQLYYVGMRMTL
ncbi:MAG: TonB-dependent receptor [Nitrospira sp.]|nr:TonB-dependent receptor [Nitrospira sp.]